MVALDKNYYRDLAEHKTDPDNLFYNHQILAGKRFQISNRLIQEP